MDSDLLVDSRRPEHWTSWVRLKPGVVPLWRDTETVQFRVDPGHALVVGNLDSAASGVLRLLGGRASPADIDRAGGDQGQTLLRLLDDHGLLEDASSPTAIELPELDDQARARCAPEVAALALRYPDNGAVARILAHRRASRVRIVGGSRVGIALAHVLAASGLGRIAVEDDGRVDVGDPCPGAASPADVGLRRSAVATALAVRAMPPTLSDGPADFVVFAPSRPAPPEAAVWSAALAADTPVLSVGIRETTAIVGPLHAPDSLAVTGCPRCVELHRLDRDPRWPDLVQQLAEHAESTFSMPTAVLVWAAVSAAAGQVLAWLDQRAVGAGVTAVASAGASLELGLGGWAWKRRWWGPHPECDCQADTPHATGSGPEGHD
jgi:hypothetical protein